MLNVYTKINVNVGAGLDLPNHEEKTKTRVGADASVRPKLAKAYPNKKILFSIIEILEKFFNS